MALLGNNTIESKSPAKRFGNAGAEFRSNFNTPGSSRAMFTGWAGISKLSAIPRGYAPGLGAWVIARKSGDMSSVHESDFSVSATPLVLAAGINLTGDTTVTVTVPNAQAQLLVLASGLATVTLTGTGGIAGALLATGSTTFTFTPSAPLLGALANLVAPGTVQLSGSAAITAIGVLAGDILPYSALSPEGLAQAVKNLVIDKSIDGLTDLTLEGTLKLLLSFMAGKLDIVDMGGGVFQYSYRDPADTKNRIVGTVRASDGDRTAITTVNAT